MLSATPVSPEQESGSHLEWMHEPTSPTGLLRVLPVPLTTLSQPTASTVCYPGSVEHPQRTIGFSALFGRAKRRARATAQRPLSLRSLRRAPRSAQLILGKPASGE